MPELVPLEGGQINAHQLFSIKLGDNLLDFRMDYRTTLDQWSINISQNGEIIVAGAMLEPNADIIKAWNLGSTIGRLVCVSLDGSNPTLTNIGTNIRLLWYSPDE